MNKHVISVGDLVLDIILPVTLPVQGGVHQDVPQRRLEPGGAGNFMIAARRMGLAVTSAGALGADVFGEVVLAALRAEGIDTQFVDAPPGSTSTLVLTLTDQRSGEHVFVGTYGHGPEMAYPAGMDACIAGAGAIFLQGYSLFEQRVAAVSVRAVEHAYAANVPVYADAGPFMAHIAPERVAWLVSRAHHLLMTEDEVPFFAGGRTGQAAYNVLLAAGPSALVIKRGDKGCSIITPQGVNEVPGFAVPVVDTVGAGDCFDAAWIAGQLHGLPLVQCGQLANAMGAAVVGRTGAGTNAPPCSEVLALLSGAGIQVNYPC